MKGTSPSKAIQRGNDQTLGSSPGSVRHEERQRPLVGAREHLQFNDIDPSFPRFTLRDEGLWA